MAKATTLGADEIFLDLEDAVAPLAKQAARESIGDALAEVIGKIQVVVIEKRHVAAARQVLIVAAQCERWIGADDVGTLNAVVPTHHHRWASAAARRNGSRSRGTPATTFRIGNWPIVEWRTIASKRLAVTMWWSSCRRRS